MKDENNLSKLSENAKLSVKLASQISTQLGSAQICPDHIFLGILTNEESLGFRTIKTMGKDISNIFQLIVGSSPIEIDKRRLSKEINLSKDASEIIWSAYSWANKLSHVYVGTEHIMLAILRRTDLDFVKRLGKIGIDYKKFEDTLFNFATYPLGILSKPNIGNPGIDEQSSLSTFGRDLVLQANQGKIDPVVGREEELKKIINILSRRKKNNPLIVGESGVGKTALVEALALKIASGNVPTSLKDCRIVSLDIASIMAGSKMRGDVEERMLAIIEDVINSKNTIVFIDEIHNILSSHIPGMPSDIVTIIKPALLRNDFRCIGATTLSEYRNYMEEDNALVRRFQPVMVEETSIIETVAILKKMRPVLEEHHGVTINYRILADAVKLADRYVSDRYLPDKAIDLLDEACATRKLEAEGEYGDITKKTDELRAIEIEKEDEIKSGKLEKASKLKTKELKIQKEIERWNHAKEKISRSKRYEVGIDTIRGVISKWTGIPVDTLGSGEKSSLLNLDKQLARRVIGQTEAINAVANAIKRARTGISDMERPWASFLFLGPTGVGKSELAKALTKELFGDSDKLIQIDMSELMEIHSVSKLIGSPPGYIGYKEGGQLTEQVRQNPHCVILFDEVEKAHSEVLNILLQILEYGHLTDGKGRRVNFKNTVVILTSNIGAEDIGQDKILGFTNEKIEAKDVKTDKQIDAAYDVMKKGLITKLKITLRPELINRLDDIVIFRALTRVDAKKIVGILVSDLNIRLKDQGIKIKVGKDVLDFVVKTGFSHEYGARPLRRTLQDNVENILADYILAHDLPAKNGEIKEIGLIIKNNKISIK
ncbi:ATP-dependent Clp protease ATP-binding subunit [Candidatus Dojkabacteria bacterium]|jgi:ATP-dependent Clp protease ATP-binding subunit ClpC|nr:ATP-dependent Clp protease ATP-binding subunit [Candidatus Dojkabacteria bacterium]